MAVLCTWSPRMLPGMDACYLGATDTEERARKPLQSLRCSCHGRPTIGRSYPKICQPGSPVSWPGIVTEWFAKLLEAV